MSDWARKYLALPRTCASPPDSEGLKKSARCRSPRVEGGQRAACSHRVLLRGYASGAADQRRSREAVGSCIIVPRDALTLRRGTRSPRRS